MWELQGDDLAECERKRPFFAKTFSRSFKDQSGVWRNGISLGVNDLESLVTVAGEVKEWNGWSPALVISRP
ncbi:MAG: hypothetical protein A4E19_04485 [Nitrospira sp. SG-bin1]|nr:MAG: hypothetical protein A4E19_04485 [Nitrospira sp. SG-bin1]